MRKINTETVALTGVTAAVYMVATLAVSPIAFGAVQFRLSEVMVLLAWDLFWVARLQTCSVRWELLMFFSEHSILFVR